MREASAECDVTMNPIRILPRIFLIINAYMVREASAVIGPPSHNKEKENYTQTSFDTNIVIITAALLMVLICALGINIVIRCVLKFTRRVQDPQEAALRRANTGINKKELKLLPTTIYSKEHPQKHSYGGSVKDDAEDGSMLHKMGGDHYEGLLRSSSSRSSHVQDSHCPICLSEFEDGEKIRILPMCRHCFHVQCVDAWLFNHSSCPSCRGDLASLLHMVPLDHNTKRPSTTPGAVQLQIVISPSGTLTVPTLCSILPSQPHSTPSLSAAPLHPL